MNIREAAIDIIVISLLHLDTCQTLFKTVSEDITYLAGGAGSIPGQGTKIPHATWQKKCFLVLIKIKKIIQQTHKRRYDLFGHQKLIL